MALSNRTRENLQVVGSIAGIVAFLGMIILWLATKSALVSITDQTVAQIKKVAPDATPTITVDFDPLAGVGGALWSLPTLVVLLLLALVILGVKHHKLTKTTR